MIEISFKENWYSSINFSYHFYFIININLYLHHSLNFITPYYNLTIDKETSLYYINCEVKITLKNDFLKKNRIKIKKLEKFYS